MLVVGDGIEIGVEIFFSGKGGGVNVAVGGDGGSTAVDGDGAAGNGV